MSLSLNAVYSFSWIKLDFLVTSHPPCCSCSVYAQELMYDMKLFNKITASFFHHYQNMSIVEWHSNCPVAVVGLHFDIISKQGMKISSSFWFFRCIFGIRQLSEIIWFIRDLKNGNMRYSVLWMEYKTSIILIIIAPPQLYFFYFYSILVRGSVFFCFSDSVTNGWEKQAVKIQCKIFYNHSPN